MSNEITQEAIDKAIKECIWRKDVGGVSVCGGMLAPCSRTIEKGQCDTLINLFNKREDDYELATEQMEHDAMYEPTYNSEDGSM